METIREDEFRKQLKKGLSGGYLFFGEEDYLKSFAMTAAREAICPDPTFALFNDVRIDAMDYSAAALLDALTPPPMMAEQKIVTVSGVNLGGLRASEIEALCEALETLREYDYNVLILSVPAGQLEEGNLPKSPSPLFKRLSEYLTPVRFDPITGARLAAWVGKHFQHHGVSADPAVCTYLIDFCGKSMYTLSSESEKLAYYVLRNGRQTVTREDVETVCISELSADTYALANAITDGKYEEAIRALEVMRYRRVDPVSVLAEVSRVICDLVTVKALAEEGLQAGEIATILKKKDFWARKYYGAASGKSMKRLKRALQLCSEADLSLKSQGFSGYLAIERLIGML